MSAHTPGPWSLHGEYSTKSIYGRGENISGVVALVNCDWPSFQQKAEQHANARLIAAAPELLEALNACLDHGSMTGDEWVTDKALAAIAKATGAA